MPRRNTRANRLDASRRKSAVRKAKAKFDAVPDYPPPLPDEEVRELLQRYWDGDDAAGQKLVLHNMRFVVREAGRLARRFDSRNTALLVEELQMEGVLAVMACMKKGTFKLDRGVKFSSYAFKTITHRMAVWAFCNSRGITRLPLYVAGLPFKLKKAQEALAANPQDAKLKKAVENIEKKIKQVASARLEPESITPMGGNSESDEAEYGYMSTPPENNPARIVADQDELESLRRSMKRLAATDPFKAEVVGRVFALPGFAPAKMADISREKGVVREAVRWNRKRAVRKLGEMMGAHV